MRYAATTMANLARKRATYADVLAAPENMVAEVLDGELHVQPRPAKAHLFAATVLGEELGPPFRRGRGGPGGWVLLDEPELHLVDDILVPDLAGWRRDRLAVVADDQPYFSLAPDWVCEVLSPSTARLDRTSKLAIYARERVKHAWLVDPLLRTLEVLRLEGERWSILATHRDDATVRAEPFEAFELELGVLWVDGALGIQP
jgi:Uma2 family endonuclease